MPRWEYQDRRERVCLIPIPRLTNLRAKARDASVYISGGLFALGWWFFIDAVICSKSWDPENGPKPVSVEFVDWVPGICSTLGMI
ncbi:hypothetical protein BGZ80_002087, partial [Entomortierella chlamydospora]